MIKYYFSPSEVKKAIEEKQKYDPNNYFGDIVLNGVTYMLKRFLFINPWVCNKCKQKVAFFHAELVQNGRLRLRAYIIRSDGVKVLLTKDHIHPKSKWKSKPRTNLGADSNIQPLCADCNVKKGHKHNSKFMELAI